MGAFLVRVGEFDSSALVAVQGNSVGLDQRGKVDLDSVWTGSPAFSQATIPPSKLKTRVTPARWAILAAIIERFPERH